MKSSPSMLRFFNGPIVTMDADDPVAGEVVTSGHRIVWVGRRGSAPTEYRRARPVDLKGRLLLPAFSDAHTHFLMLARALSDLDLRRVHTSVALRECLRRHRQATGVGGGWIIGHGFDPNLWLGARPSRKGLDDLELQRPIAIFSHDEHSLWVNTIALRRAGIDRETPDPPGGRIERDSSGQPTGILYETACNLVWGKVPEPTLSEAERLIAQTQSEAHAVGVAAIHDMGHALTLAAFHGLREKGRLRLRLWKSIGLDHLDEAVTLGLRSGLGDRWIKIGAVKIFLDGALGSRTAWMYRPYTGDRSHRGICRMEKAEFADVVRRAAAHGLSVCVHAIGDAAVGQAVDVLRRHEARFPRRQPPRIEHLQLIDPKGLKRLAGSRIIASMQPSHLLTDRDYVDRHWGRRVKDAFVFRSLWDQGTVMAFGSDAPIERLCPIDGIGAAVHRACPKDRRGSWYPRQRLSVWEAVWGFSVGAAIAAGDGDQRGRIAPGMLADLVVLDRNIFAIHPSDVFAAQVMMTVVDGDCVYERSA
ncbi:MAG: amidohydrolase [Candidatus Zixiibacteriota bacterium]